MVVIERITMKQTILENENNTVKILGTEYTVKVDDNLIKQGADGMCKEYTKEILVRSAEDMLCEDDAAEVKEKRFKEVLRHEIIHAFFCEAGLDDYSSNEQLVDWLAKQFPKMVQAFEMQKCL